jgi:hypothetical protein
MISCRLTISGESDLHHIEAAIIEYCNKEILWALSDKTHDEKYLLNHIRRMEHIKKTYIERIQVGREYLKKPETRNYVERA